MNNRRVIAKIGAYTIFKWEYTDKILGFVYATGPKDAFNQAGGHLLNLGYTLAEYSVHKASIKEVPSDVMEYLKTELFRETNNDQDKAND